MDIDTLTSLKYLELQKLAKKHGIKANQKADKLIKLIRLLHQQQKDNSKEDIAPRQENDTNLAEETVTITAAKKAVGRNISKRDRRTKRAAQEPMPEFSSGSILKTGTPVTKPRSRVRLVTPKLLGTPKDVCSTGHVTPCDKVVNMPTSLTPHPSKSTEKKSITASISNNQQAVKSKQKEASKPLSASKRRTSPRNAALVETDKQDKEDVGAKKVRRSTFEVKKDEAATEQKSTEESKQNAVKANCNIPRFTAFLAAKKIKTASATKDWSKLHQKHFENMESIDDYLARKRKRTDELTASVKRAKTLSKATKDVVDNMKVYRTPLASTINKKPNMTKRVSIPSPSFQSPKVFVPRVTSTKNMNIHFDKNIKLSTMFVSRGATVAAKTPKTPVRKSVAFFPQAAANKSINKTVEKRKSLGTALTPFKFIGNTCVGPLSPKKTTFDLKASLAKPLAYKPYTGKLNDNKKLNVTKAKENLKKPKVLSMKERRVQAAKKRGQRKDNAVNTRRGIKL